MAGLHRRWSYTDGEILIMCTINAHSVHSMIIDYIISIKGIKIFLLARLAKLAKVNKVNKISKGPIECIDQIE